MRYLVLILLLVVSAEAQGMLAGGRPNAFSEGNNAFAGVVNPANAVWIVDRFDIGGFWTHQTYSLNNKDNNPGLPPGKTDYTYRAKNLFTYDAAIHKHAKLNFCSKSYDSTFTLASYTVPSSVKLRTKYPIPASGTTPLGVYSKTEVISAIFSLKLSPAHSIGFSVDYLYFSHSRDGFQNADNPLRSVSPGHVTNNGTDHSYGFGCSIGWRWNITEQLKFGASWVRKSYGGQYRKYRGYEPHHARNYVPQTLGGGFSYHATKKLAGRLEVLWSNFGNLPGANNNVLSNGSLNSNKRGSNKSPGPGLQDAVFINTGVGYRFLPAFTMGLGYSHRIKWRRSSNILSHTYALQTIYDLVSMGMNISYKKHDLFLVSSYGFRNRTTGRVPIQRGGGEFVGDKQTIALSLSWGYKY